MKAIFSWGAGSFGLLLMASISQAYYWVTPVTKCPYPQAPDTYNSGFYLVDWCGRVTGPHYYLMPPCPPFNGVLPARGGQGSAPQGMPGSHGPYGAVQPFGPMQAFQPFGQFQAMTPMGAPPHGPPLGGGAYPVHPFTRSPRDFFMWGDMMEEERARGNRPFPVP
jgi:hypothetical protein